MIRELTSHKVNGLNEAIQIQVIDEPGQGGACHSYRIAPYNGAEVSSPFCCDINFQNGPIKEAGFNGISQEALLAVVEDRLKSFQAGPYSCRENSLALTKGQEAMKWLQHRTNERMQRGVEGTHEK